MQFAVEYPDRPLNRLTTALRPFVAIPILIVLVSIGGVSADWAGETRDFTIATLGGILFVPPLPMIVFRRKYPPVVVRLQPRAATVHQPRERVPGADGGSVSVD